MLNNLYHAQDCHCGIPILEPDENICTECKKSQCGENYECAIFHEYRKGSVERAASIGHRYRLKLRTNGTYPRQA